MHCCIPTPTTDSNTSTGMIWVTLNMPSAAEECRKPSRKCQGISRCNVRKNWLKWHKVKNYKDTLHSHNVSSQLAEVIVMMGTTVNRWDFRYRRKDDRVDAAVTVGGRLFQALVPAAEKDRSLSVDLRVAGTTNADKLEDLRRCRDSNCATCRNCSEVPGCAYTWTPIHRVCTGFSLGYAASGGPSVLVWYVILSGEWSLC